MNCNNSARSCRCGCGCGCGCGGNNGVTTLPSFPSAFPGLFPSAPARYPVYISYPAFLMEVPEEDDCGCHRR